MVMVPAPSARTPASLRRRSPGLLALLALVAAIAGGSATAAQAQTQPPALPQDEIDLQGRLNIVVGAGARALGMGGAFLARADDATAASWNPAGLSYLLRPEVSLVAGANRVEMDSPGEISRFSGFEPDFVAVTWPLPSINGSAQLSYQRLIPFSGHRTIEREGSHVTLDPQGGFDVLALGTGWKVAPTLRVGATLNRWLNGFHQVRVLRRTPGRFRNTTLDADFGLRGWNMNLGFIWSPWETLNIGGVAKTPFSGRVRLKKKRSDYFFLPSGAPDPEATTENSFEKDDLRLDFPSAYGVGASWRVRSSITVSADYTRTSWAEARIYGFFSLEVRPSPDEPAPAPTFYDALPYPLFDTSQSDTEQFRAGLEYVIIRDRFKWPLRVGYILDRQFFRAAGGRAPVFQGLTVGTGIILGPVLLDAAYLREVGNFISPPDVSTMPSSVPIRQGTYRLLFSAIYRHGATR